MQNLAEHYDSYKKSLQDTCLDGFIQFARSGKAGFNDFMDNAKVIYTDVQQAIESGDTARYKLRLKSHQTEFKRLFSAMVESELGPRLGSRPDGVLDLVLEFGWKWFRHHDKAVVFRLEKGNPTGADSVVVVPRYDMIMAMPKRTIISDSREMFGQSKSSIKANTRATFKQREVEKYSRLRKTNVGLVTDWALPLFPEEDQNWQKLLKALPNEDRG